MSLLGKDTPLPIRHPKRRLEEIPPRDLLPVVLMPETGTRHAMVLLDIFLAPPRVDL